MVEAAKGSYKEYAIEEFLVRDEPYYRPIGDEIELFTAAYRQHIPVLLKGPTGCGKTRFVEFMAWQLGRPMATIKESRIPVPKQPPARRYADGTRSPPTENPRKRSRKSL